MPIHAADRVHRNLWMGSAPHRWAPLREHFNVLVLCAMEYQPRSACFEGVRVIHAPLDDSAPTPREIRIANEAANRVVVALRDGQTVLVTCMQGRNRSGLVSALALKQLGAPPSVAIKLVRRARGDDALANPYFVALIKDTYSTSSLALL